MKNNIVNTIGVTLLLTLTGCVDVEPTYTANGQRGYTIDCSGDLSTWGECYEEAGATCGAKGYKVLEKLTDSESNTYADKDVLSSSSSHTRNLIIKCK